MPLPMVHLAIAAQLQKADGEGLSPAFLLGSLAPDAIHMRLNAGLGAKAKVHLVDAPDPQFERVRALLGAEAEMGFAAGYAAHLLTDHLWREQVIEPFHRDSPPDLAEEVKRALYYRETDQVDFDLYHRMPWRQAVWRLLADARPPDFAGLLTGAEIGGWRDRTLGWFNSGMQEPGIEPVYIRYGEVLAFIDRAAAWVADTLGAWEAPVRGESAGCSANSLRVAGDPNGDALEDEGGWDAGTGPGIHHR